MKVSAKEMTANFLCVAFMGVMLYLGLCFAAAVDPTITTADMIEAGLEP